MPHRKSAPTGSQTAKNIKLAIARIEHGRPKIISKNRKLSIASVAEEAGISRASIHNNYPSLAERIREANNKTARIQRDTKQQQIKSLKEKYSEIRSQLSDQRELNTMMASKLATLELENAHLRAIVGSENVAVFKPVKLGKR